MNKRRRTENWMPNDKRILRNLLAERIDIIENKCVDTVSNRMKRECWAEITDAFNAVSEIKRDVVQVQFQWRTQKMRAKMAEAAYIKAKNQPGESSPPQSPSKEDREIMELITISNKFNRPEKPVPDSDGPVPQFTDEYIKTEILDHFAEEYKDNNFEKVYFAESNHSPQQYVNDKPPKLESSTMKKVQRKKKIFHDAEASQKRELFDLTKLHMIEEHEERMAVLELEKQCRLKELEKIELEIKLMQK